MKYTDHFIVAFFLLVAVVTGTAAYQIHLTNSELIQLRARERMVETMVTYPHAVIFSPHDELVGKIFKITKKPKGENNPSVKFCNLSVGVKTKNYWCMWSTENDKVDPPEKQCAITVGGMKVTENKDLMFELAESQAALGIEPYFPVAYIQSSYGYEKGLQDFLNCINQPENGAGSINVQGQADPPIEDWEKEESSGKESKSLKKENQK